MTTVTEARRELAQIAERQAELQAIVDAAPKSLLTSGVVLIRDYLRCDLVSDHQTASAYAEALDTLLMLRHQPGSEAANYDRQWVIRVNAEISDCSPDDYHSQDYKVTRISPCFESEIAALNAIDTIGADRILRMFRTLHGVA